MAKIGYVDTAAIPERKDFDPIPPADYQLVMVDSVMQDTKDKTGQYLNCEFVVVGGQYDGRKVWDRFNLVNKSQEAQRIAYEALGQLVRACGKQVITDDSAELHGIPVIATVIFVPADGQWKAKNEIKKYAPAFQQPAAQAPANQAYAHPGAPPPAAAPGNAYAGAPPAGYAQQPAQQPQHQPPVTQQPVTQQNAVQPHQQPMQPHQPPAGGYQPPPAGYQPAAAAGGGPALPPWKQKK